jgi:predicted nucleotide-binding protein
MFEDAIAEFREIAKVLRLFMEGASSVAPTLDELEEQASEVAKAWSGSWLGYHANVYYRDLSAPPPGAHFSSEWGLRETFSPGTRGHWEEFTADAVRAELFRRSGNPDLEPARRRAVTGQALVEEKRDQAASILHTVLKRRDDSFLAKLLEEVNDVKVLTQSDYLSYARPHGRLMSRDSLAVSQGLRTPAHLSVVADVAALRSPDVACDELQKIAGKAADHLARQESKKPDMKGDKKMVFIGHGQSPVWKELKEFIQDRLRLPWDEFNRVSPAGLANVSRLETMLNAAGFAFLVMTAEDEHADGKRHARENVIHEAGLFQGRLGFSKAIILLEEGCSEFGNIEGLGQIRFSQGHLDAKFEEVRKVLEREGPLPGD